VNADAKTALNRCSPVSEWPAQDQAAWALALQPGDALDPRGIAARWASSTCRMVENGYGRWLGWLHTNGLLDPGETPDQRVTKERVAAYVADLTASTAPFSVQSRVRQLGSALHAMCPHGDWGWILRGADRIRVRAIPVRNKRTRLQSPARLVALGMQLMAEADTAAADQPIVRATAYRDGLLIALLAHRPIRGRNLAAIICGQHLVRRGAGWWLLFQASETKTRQALELPFPADLVLPLERYLTEYRPVLLFRGKQRTKSPTSALWVSSHGTHMSYAAIGHQVRSRTGTAFGAALSPHLFRDCAATEIAITAPENARSIPSVLGHADPATAERHYNLAGSLEASRRYGSTIQMLRQDNSASAKRRL